MPFPTSSGPLDEPDLGHATGSPAVDEPRSFAMDDAVRAHQERLLDEALKETFPASDPLSVMRLT